MDELAGHRGPRSRRRPSAHRPAPISVLGMLQGRNVAFLARHGLHHDLLPSEVKLHRGEHLGTQEPGGAARCSVYRRVGSLREEIRPGRPGPVVTVSGFLRKACALPHSSARGLAAHVSTANPDSAAPPRPGVVARGAGVGTDYPRKQDPYGVIEKARGSEPEPKASFCATAAPTWWE